MPLNGDAATITWKVVVHRRSPSPIQIDDILGTIYVGTCHRVVVVVVMRVFHVNSQFSVSTLRRRRQYKSECDRGAILSISIRLYVLSVFFFHHVPCSYCATQRHTPNTRHHQHVRGCFWHDDMFPRESPSLLLSVGRYGQSVVSTRLSKRTGGCMLFIGNMLFMTT